MVQSHFPDIIRSLPNYKGQFSAFELIAAGCKILFATFEPGKDIPPHAHPTENVGIVTKGVLQLTQNGVKNRYGVGEWYHIADDVVHSARFDEASATIEFWFDGSGGDPP